MNVAAPSKNIVNALLDLVRSKGYGPGDRLPPIRELSAELGFGRNAIRDGLLEAQTLGFVRIEPRLGVFVQSLDAANRADGFSSALDKILSQEEHNLFHVVDARLLVEVELAGAAARMRRPEDLLPLRQALENVSSGQDDRLAYIQADEAFHLAIARIAGNRVLFLFLQSLWRVLRPAKLNLLLSTENRARSDREHQELFRHIVDGDADKARAVMSTHIGQGRSLLLQHVRTLPEAEPHKARASGG